MAVKMSKLQIALKGRRIPAQGNALGLRVPPFMRSEGTPHPRGHVEAFSHVPHLEKWALLHDIASQGMPALQISDLRFKQARKSLKFGANCGTQAKVRICRIRQVVEQL
jgi:hypothetical protein